jgi:hypothetical protein
MDFEPLSVEIELTWALEIVRQNLESVRPYLGHRDRLEKLILADEGHAALSELEALVASTGYSLFAISTKIALLQMFKGLEAQKDYLAALRASGATNNLSFFSYWWSVRAEESTTWRNFHRDFKRKLKRWTLTEPFRAHIAFEILGELPPEGQEATLLTGSFLGSAIDVYEALVSICQLAVVEQRPGLPTILPVLRELSKLTEDGRVKKALFLAGDDVDLACLPPPDLEWRDASVAFAPEHPGTAPASLEELRAALSGNLPYEPEGPFQRQLTSDLQDLCAPERAAHARDNLLKTASMLQFLGTGQWLVSIAGETADRGSGPHIATAKRRFLSVPAVEPEVASSLLESQREELFRILPAPEQHAYLVWQTRLATKAPIAGSHELAELPLLELRLLEALEKGDAAELVERAEAFEQAAGHHSFTSLNAHLRGVLGRDGLAAAARLAVNYLLRDPALAGWLPITDLAASLLGKERLAANVIEVPILLDFAAEIQADPFGSERTYAIEDYLQALGALRPTDLLQRIPRAEASEKDVHFFRKVCSIAALRTSMLFQNEKELEDERTAVCQWLNEMPNVWFDQLEEEAREIVRNRQIRQGLKALEGSKLSVDSAGIRNWADRALREDYNRYIALLRSGVFKIDDSLKQALAAVLEGDQDRSAELTVPDNEAATLFASIFARAIREYAVHAEHGLDAYLSLRIRHGTISGHLRGPIEQEHLITRRDSDGDYLTNEYWDDQLGGTLHPASVRAIDQRLAKLSEDYDAIIERLTKRLVQVHSAEKPDGLIKVEVSPAVVVSTMVDVGSGTSFDDFMSWCEDIFWAIIEANSSAINAAVRQLTVDVQALFQQAEQDINVLAGDNAGQLRDALLRGRTVAVTQLEKIRDWLQTPTTPASLSLDVEALIQVSLSIIQSFYSSFRPSLTVRIQTSIHLVQAVRWFSDVFFIIFENVLKYSGNAEDPEVCVEVNEEGDQLSFTVRNSVCGLKDADRARIEAARQRILDGSFRTAVRSEGGTGLPKLAKVIGFGSGDSELEFGMDEGDHNFEVRFKVRKITIAEAEPA